MTVERARLAESIRALVARTGGDATRVVVEPIAPGPDRAGWATGVEAAAVGGFEARDGTLTLRGTDPISAASAYARYLASHGRRITWEAPVIRAFSGGWPDAPATVISTPFAIRYDLNVVTHGYSTPFWDWARWERELDWMALHGVTHPLVLTAYEVVLDEALRRSGVAADEARAWIGGAPHLPWMSMGGVHDFGGPLPESWGIERVRLARRILARARDFGMTPVLPVTAGQVPRSLAGPEAAEIEWQGWRAPVLEPSSEEYRRFVATFLEVQRELLGDPGPAPVVAVDPYIESLPPSGDPAALAAAGGGIHRAISSVLPGATWLLQGWPFHYHRGFWTPERVEAYLSEVPHDSLLLIDLWGEHAPMWRGGMHGRRWIWTAIHNFGGRFALFGDLRGLARDVSELVAAEPERWEGIGLAPEAIENNSVFYEAASDLVWGPIDVEPWLDAFADQRYGIASEAARTAWRLLGATLYGPGRTRSIPSPVIARPWDAVAPFAAQRLAGEALPEPARMSANVDAENDPAVLGDLPDIARAARLLISIADESPERDVLEHDVVELTGHVLAQRMRERIRGILAGFAARDAGAISVDADRLSADLLELDLLVDTRPESRASTWIDAARRWGATPEEAAVMDRDARSLVSVWGHQTSGLHDYSGRHWSSLIADLYLPRWQAWADWLARASAEGTEPDVEELRSRIVEIEEAWRSGSAGTAPAPAPEEDPLGRAAAVLDRLGY